MISFRPTTDGRYIRRHRLLELMPDTAGYVVMLEAPYGYGKSVLASQWAAGLEQDGNWRTIWLALEGSDPKLRLANALNLPPDIAWSGVFDALWSEKTLLVLEDIEELSDSQLLTPLLRQVHGLLLLASRTPLVSPELPRLITQGRLLHLRAAELCFSDQETRLLLDDNSVEAKRLQELTGGWPLPLHFATITGHLPEGPALLEGMRSGLSEPELEELLLLASVSYLPESAATAATWQLAGNGYVQTGETGFRLHRMVAAPLLELHRADMIRILRRESGRLSAILLGEAAERIGDSETLAELLSQPREQHYRHAPEYFIRWSRQLPDPATPLQLLTVGAAHKLLGQFDESAVALRKALDLGGLAPEDELFGLKELAWTLATSDVPAARKVVAAGERLLDRVDDELAGRFLSDAAFVEIMAAEHDKAATRLEQALARLPKSSPYRTGPAINLALNRWDAYGDLDGRLAAQEQLLDTVFSLYPSDGPGQSRDVAMMHAWLGNTERSRHHFELAVKWARSAPLISLEASAALAADRGDQAELLALVERARRYGHDYTLDMVTSYAITALPASTPLRMAEQLYLGTPKPILATAAWALRLGIAGRVDEAILLLDNVADSAAPRAVSIYLQSARYRLTRARADLEALMDLTLVGERILPRLVPIDELPQDSPELSLGYALQTVLDSGWQAAIALRRKEIPPLELDLLGQRDARPAGRPDNVELTERHWQLLILLMLGRNREEAAELMWPDIDVARQRNNLHVHQSQIRKRLEPWGLSTYLTEEGLSRTESDLTRLLVALEKQDAETVMALYREPFAPGVNLPLVDEYRIWLRESVTRCLLAGARSGSGVQATRLLRRLLELDPLNEEGVRELLQHMLKHGQDAAARELYERFRARLAEETGLEPEAATSEIMASTD